MRNLRAISAAAALCLGLGATGRAGEAARGTPAPPFELPALGGGRLVASEDLFERNAKTFVVFWDGECPACVESLRECQAFHERVEGGDVAVVGVNGDRGDDLSVRMIVVSSGVTFPQLRDRDGAAAAAWGVPPSTFALFLVDRDGTITARRLDPDEPIPGLMERMLLGEAGTEPAAGEAAAGLSSGIPLPAGLVIRGDARVKFLSIDVEGDGAVGPYGERLDPGNVLLQRIEFEASMPIGQRLRVGGMLRAENEGIEALRSGPQYLDSERGSMFASIDAGRFTARLGYFTMHMTPLTMTRWDWNDNPRTGGDAGCGCGATAGILIVRSLEELGPDLTLEGATAGWSSGEFETRTFYAMPRRARDTPATVWLYGGEEPAAYSLEIYGFHGQWRRYDRRTGGSWSAGVHLLGHREDAGSIDPVELGYAPLPAYEGEILTATARIPLLRSLSLEGEWIARCAATGRNLGPGRDERADLDGSGGIAGIVAGDGGPMEWRLEYLRLGEGFYSPFAAISYEAGRHGARGSAVVRLPGGWSALSLFHKHLREIDPPAPGADREEIVFTGVTIDVDHPAGPGGSLSWLDRGESRGGGTLGYDDSRRTMTAGLRYRFGKRAWIEGLYQLTDAERTGEGEGGESRTRIYSVSFRAQF